MKGLPRYMVFEAAEHEIFNSSDYTGHRDLGDAENAAQAASEALYGAAILVVDSRKEEHVCIYLQGEKWVKAEAVVRS